MYNILDRLENFKFTYDDDPDVNYLKECLIGDVVNRALADLYETQPKNPVNFLANWLLVESQGQEIKKMIEVQKNLKLKTKANFQVKKKKLEEQQKQKELEFKKYEDEKALLIKKIKSLNNFELNLNEMCNDIKKITRATGVYFCIYDNKRKQVKEEESESAHLLSTKVIRYIGFCNDHEFLKFDFLDFNKGVTYDLFNKNEKAKKVESTEEENADEKAAAAAAKKALELAMEAKNSENDVFNKDFNFILIDEVVRNTKIKFFREPRLGCYLAIEIIINSSLSNTSLNSAIENIITYKNKIADYEFRKNEYLKNREDELPSKDIKKESEAEKASKAQENPKEGEDPNMNNSQTNKLNNSGSNVHNASGGFDNANAEENIDMGFPEEHITLEDYIRTEKKYILCLDTLGQDRVFNFEEKSFIFEAVKTIKIFWEELEKTLLLKDRDLRLKQMDKENVLRDPQYIEKLENDEEKYVKELFQLEKYAAIEDSGEKALLSELFKARFIIYSVQQEQQTFELFQQISQFEFIEYEKLIQNILYFSGYENTQINEVNTNKLDWGVAKKFWTSSILDILLEYEPFGPKAKLPTYKLHNKFLSYLEILDKEGLSKYNYILGKIADFIRLVLTMRRNDILKRREIINAKILEREELIREQFNRSERRMAEFEEHKKSLENLENPEERNFDENAWFENWDNNNKEIIVPDEVEIDVDDDFIIE